ncbi:MAG: TetR family transcriptional regulator [Clostridiales bacterium]|jgi:AcrR family transcriptional regulator|nr:TetR family transcriptional regulator [Clostridiales bacterium]
MYKKFESLIEEKRIRIINASFNEFASKQFKEASTEEIAKNAEISKGALFQYFGTKKQLYIYALNFAYQVFAQDFWGEVDFSKTDIFERIRETSTLKMKLFCKYPSIFQFILNSYREKDRDIVELIKKELEVHKITAYSKLYENLDLTKIKDEFNSTQVLSIIEWTLDGYAKSEIEKLKPGELNVDKCNVWLQEIDNYIISLKKAFYKEGN